jgi:hypothetical protein
MHKYFDYKEVRSFFVYLRKNPYKGFVDIVELILYLIKIFKYKFINSYLKKQFKNNIRYNSGVHPINLPHILKNSHTDGRAYALLDNNFQYFFDKSDIESYFYTNRWSNCCLAMITSFDDSKEALLKCEKWILSAPDKDDVAWETYSTCERVSNILLMLSIYPDLINNSNQKTIYLFILESIEWIDGNLEDGSKGVVNNHILNNARSLIIGGTSLGMEVYITTGYNILNEYVDILINKGGFLRERSSHYQLIVTNWMLDCLTFLEFYNCLNAKVFDLNPLKFKIKNIMRATNTLNVNLLNSSCIGDISPDMHPQLSFARLVSLYSKFITKQIYKNKIVDDWFFVNCYNSTITGCFFKKWPVPYLNHGHNDLLSFIWLYKKQLIIVDSGRYRYTKDCISISQQKNDYHNSIEIDGQSPAPNSLLVNSGLYVKNFSSIDVNVNLNPGNRVSISHNGYFNYGNIMHNRSIKCNARDITIKDTLKGVGLHNIDILFHLFPDFKIVNNQKKILYSSNYIVKFNCSSGNNNFSYNYKNYQFSNKYGDTKKAIKLIINSSIELPCVIETIIGVEKCAV